MDKINHNNPRNPEIKINFRRKRAKNGKKSKSLNSSQTFPISNNIHQTQTPPNGVAGSQNLMNKLQSVPNNNQTASSVFPNQLNRNSNGNSTGNFMIFYEIFFLLKKTQFYTFLPFFPGFFTVFFFLFFLLVYSRFFSSFLKQFHELSRHLIQLFPTTICAPELTIKPI